MSDDMTGDAVYQPEPDPSERDNEGQLEPEDTLYERAGGEVLDEGYSPPDHPPPVYREWHEETLDERLAEELPDVSDGSGDGVGDTSDTDGEALDDEVGNGRAGRLVAPGEGAHDEHEGMVASDKGIDGAAASAEEAAMHVVPDEE